MPSSARRRPTSGSSPVRHITADSGTGAGPDVEVVHRADRNRFDLLVDGRLASWLDYEPGADAAGPIWTVTHTVTLPELRGRGLADRLVAHAVSVAAADGVRIRPHCPYVRSWLLGHPEHADIVV